MRKLTYLFTLIILAVATLLSQPSRKVSATPTPNCELTSQLCRDTSRALYDLCIASGGGYSNCAWQEALNTLKCMKDAGCSDMPKAPGESLQVLCEP